MLYTEIRAMYVHTLLPLHLYLYSFMQDDISLALIIAAEAGHPDTVERLLEGGANVNHKNTVRNLEQITHVTCIMPSQESLHYPCNLPPHWKFT